MRSLCLAASLCIALAGCSDTSNDNNWQPVVRDDQRVWYWLTDGVKVPRYQNREACLRATAFGMKKDRMQKKPGMGCMYVGTSNKYVGYAINYWYESDALKCVAEIKEGEPGRMYGIVLTGHPPETEEYFCVLPDLR